MKVKVSDVVANFLKEHEINTVFGIIGSANSHIFDSINNLGFTKIINVHHEQVAVMAAGAYYRASGSISAAIVTAGAGASNAITGVVSNWADSIPSIIISGQEPYRYVVKHKSNRMFGTQGFDIVKMVKDVTKYGVSISKPDQIHSELTKTLELSKIGRPGPTWIDIPFDIQAELVESIPSENSHQYQSDYENFTLEVLNEINSSSKPVILGGHGVKLSNSRDVFKQVVEKLQIPTLLTWSGIDLLPSDHPDYYGSFGVYGQRCANFIIQNADLIIVLGSRLALPQIGYDFGQFARNAKIILVDIDEQEGNKFEIFKFIKQDCKIFLDQLYSSISETNLKIKEWKVYCDSLQKNYPLIDKEHESKGFVNSYQFIDNLSNHLQKDDIIVTDMGTALLSGHQAIKLQSDQQMFTSLGLGEMGYGLPAAIGASFACPDKRVLCLNCDGGIMMNLQEMHTIIENNLNIKIVIFNNDGYLMIKHTQKMLFKGNYNSVDKSTGIGLPNFEMLSKALGYKYYHYDYITPENRLDEFLNDPSQSVLEVFMDPEQAFLPKVKGVLNDDNSILSPPLEEMSPLLPLETIKKEMKIKLHHISQKIKR